MSTFDSDGGERLLRPVALDRLWDAMNRQISPVGGRTGAASIETAETIRRLSARDDAPEIAPAQLDSIWATIAAAALPANPAVEAPYIAQRANAVKIFALLQTIIRQASIGALMGFLVGMLVIGGGARLFMRVAAVMSAPQLAGTMTENGNAVGSITLAGSLSLLLFSGAIPGLLGGIVVMALRPWLPASGWRRLLLAGVVGFAVAGQTVLEGGRNADYQRFGILGLNVCLFTLLPFLFGIAVVPAIDALDSRVPRDLPSLTRGLHAFFISLGMGVLALPLIPLTVMAFTLAPASLLFLLPVIRVVAPSWARHAPSLDERRRRELRGMQVGYVALAAPCVLGLVLMAQSVARLMH